MAISRTVLVLIIVVAFNVPARAADDDKAKAAAAPPAAAAAQGQPAPEDDPDLDIDPLQPDFTLVALPTTLRMPRMKSSFRVTHRFTRSLGQGDFGSLLEDFFGIDSGAAIGLEYRFGIIRGAHVGFRRTNPLQRTTHVVDVIVSFPRRTKVGLGNDLSKRNSSPIQIDI